MKQLLLLSVLAVSCLLVVGFKRRTKNSNCLVMNKYANERHCRRPRRIYFVFHRVIFDCIQVTSRCHHPYKRNEFATLQKCRDGCAYHMKIPKPPVPGSSTAAPVEEVTETLAPEVERSVPHKTPA
ncbi:uncharacterized protein LOC108051633 [Drosophila rhopaloa]|uniref:Uncharacterized protein LOC108051633 n=1 Tax=Drosophila rhopaloa TaxID=1041015 RepID=A0A6P4FH79_DRORH|nr:uncharacterized protein LOC108051633 [Drosophila rhopaloa]